MNEPATEGPQADRDQQSRRKKRIFGVVAAIFLLVALEGVFFVAGKALQAKWAMWREPTPAENATREISYAEYLEVRDPVLGWPYPLEFGDNLDVSGAHHNPHFPAGPRGGSCVSLYGDSFTQGGDFSDLRFAWSNVLSKQLGCNVANWGIAGYGTDQAFLRFERNVTDSAPVVVFGVHLGDTLRNLTRIRDLENYAMWYALKPRYIVGDDGALVLVPIPDLDEGEYRAALGLTDPMLELEHESLQPGGPAGAVRLAFPFTLSVLRSLFLFHGFKARLFREPVHKRFLEPGHPLDGLPIMVGLGKKFADVAKARGKSALIAMLPGKDDYEYRLKRGEWAYRHVVAGYSREGLEIADFGPYLLAEIDRNGRALVDYFGPTGHYNDAGNALVARMVAERLPSLRP